MRKTTNSEQRENRMRIKKCLMMTVCILYFFSITPGSYAGEDVHLTTSEYLPFTTEHEKNHGFCSEIVSTVIKKMGMNPVYAFYPWKRGQAALGNGEMWATFPYVKTREREQEYWFSAQPLFTSKIRFFYHKDHLSNAVRWNTLEERKGENQSEAPLNHAASCFEPCHNGHPGIGNGDCIAIFRYGQQ
jgi:hypothetical protein